MSLSATPSDARVYVARGDSICIDDYASGPGRGAAILLLHNPDQDFPDGAGRNLTGLWPGTRLLLLATEGATSVTVVHQQLPPDPAGHRPDAGHPDHRQERPAARPRRPGRSQGGHAGA